MKRFNKEVVRREGLLACVGTVWLLGPLPSLLDVFVLGSVSWVGDNTGSSKSKIPEIPIIESLPLKLKEFSKYLVFQVL